MSPLWRDRRFQVAILVAMNLIVVVFALTFFFTRPAGEQESPRRQSIAEDSGGAKLEPMGAPKPKGKIAALPSITFSKSLTIAPDGVVVDGRDSLGIACDGDDEGIATLALDVSSSATLNCSQDYLGGFSLHYENGQNELKRLDLAQRDGDAGEAWDFRSLVKRDEEGVLVIETLSYSSSAKEGGDVKCLARRKAVEWSSATREFIETDAKGDLKDDMFPPPINVDPSCLDGDGKFKR